jgi:hypothetical protein
MAKARSPQYPAIGLKDAVEKISAVYGKDYQNPIPRAVVAKHMGYDSLHGKALGVLSALGKYGLLEGRGDDSRVSDLAVTIIAHQPGTAERAAALREAASKPDLFADLNKRFNDGKVSDHAIRSYLMTQKFIPTAADTVIRAYRDTKQLVEAESGGYIEPAAQETPMNQGLSAEANRLLDMPPKLIKPPGMLQEVFNLEEGPVTLTFPSTLSGASYTDLADHLELFLRKAKRRAANVNREEHGQDPE